MMISNNDILNKKGRLLGLDLGKKTLGLSVSDESKTIATSLVTIKRTKLQKDFSALNSVINEYNIIGLVVGLPINMDGSEGPRCQATKQFVSDFLKFVEIPVFFCDERLSTIAATRVLNETKSSRYKKSKVVDKIAATFILQGLLDSLRYERNNK